MEVVLSHRIPVTETTQVGEARRLATRLAERAGLGEVESGRAALAATELASNVLKHTPQGGELLLRPLWRRGTAGVEVLALDRGPGILDVPQAMEDGYSTAGSAGEGLGAVARAADLFQLHTTPGAGTVLLAQVWEQPLSDAARRGLWTGVVCLPKPGQELGGDAWAQVEATEALTLLVCDGLGHGRGAYEASAEATRVFRERADRPPGEVLEAIHPALRATRGAAVAVARIDAFSGALTFAGVGNIAGVVLGAGEPRSVVSHNGIVGHEMRRIQEFSYPWTRGSALVLHSDGMLTRWSLAGYPGLLQRHPSLIAGVMYRDFHRGTDDATVLVVRELT